MAAAAGRVRIVDFFWADPDPALVEVAHRGGALACWQVGSLDEALAAAEAGCDVVAVQGTEAGGHVRGHSELRPLLESVLGRVGVPVLAAGGIGDARAFAGALAAGADGVRAGTRFVAAAESGRAPGVQAGGDGRGGRRPPRSPAPSPSARCARPRRGPGCCGPASARCATWTARRWARRRPGGRQITLPKGHGTPPGAAATGHIGAMPMYAGESAASDHLPSSPPRRSSNPGPRRPNDPG